jgi:hypothetical protein
MPDMLTDEDEYEQIEMDRAEALALAEELAAEAELREHYGEREPNYLPSYDDHPSLTARERNPSL